MRGAAELSADGRTVAVSVPIKIRKRGGRKVVVAPDTESTRRSSDKPNEVLVRALARAFRWRGLIETGVYGTLAELASAEKVNPSYVSRMLKLTLLSPAAVEAILDGKALTPIPLAQLHGSMHDAWPEHSHKVGWCSPYPWGPYNAGNAPGGG